MTKRDFFVVVVVALSFAVSAPSLSAPANVSTKKLEREPNSYEAATGVRDPEYTTTLPDLSIDGAATLDNDVLGLSAAALQALEAPSVVNAPPAGNMYLRSRINPDGTTSCVIANSTEQDVFSETFTTGPATSYMEINFSGQVQIPPGTVSNGLYFKCTVTQGATVAPCASSLSKFAFVRRPRVSATQYLGITTYNGYVGYVSGVSPSTSTTVRISAQTDTDTANVCFANLILRY